MRRSRQRGLARTISAAALVLLAAPTSVSAGTASSVPPSYCTVLLYHKFDEPRYASTNISSTEFREQLRYLRDGGYRVLSIDEFVSHLENGTPFPQRSVLITIDDPYPSIDRVARPILREFGYPWTLFVWTEGVENGYPDLMSWEDIARLAATDGITVANHTHSHAHLALPGASESRESYLDRIAEEIQAAQRLLRERGIENSYIAFPYGYYNNVVIDAARTAGYRFMFTQDPGAVDDRTPHDRIPRAAIVGAEQSIDDFAYRLSLSPLHVTDIRPIWGVLEENPPPEIGLRILDPLRYRRDQVNMFISEWSRVDADYDAESGEVRYTPSSGLTRKMNRMIVTARDAETGTFSMYAQMLIRPFPAFSTDSR